jgi:hypothetical protein
MTLGHFKCPYFLLAPSIINVKAKKRTVPSAFVHFDFFIVSFQEGGVRPQDRHERAEEDHRGLRGYG